MKSKAIFLLFCVAFVTGCAWIQAHKQPLTTTAEIIGKRVFIIASKVAIDTVLNSRDPEATLSWQEFAAADLNSRKWTAINSDDIMAIANAWKQTAPPLVPVADEFARLWDKMQPKSQAEIESFLKAYSASLATPRAALPE